MTVHTLSIRHACLHVSQGDGCTFTKKDWTPALERFRQQTWIVVIVHQDPALARSSAKTVCQPKPRGSAARCEWLFQLGTRELDSISLQDLALLADRFPLPLATENMRGSRMPLLSRHLAWESAHHHRQLDSPKICRLRRLMWWRSSAVGDGHPPWLQEA